MKKLILFFYFLFFLIPDTALSQSPVIQSIIDQTNIDSLTYFVKELSGEVQTIIGGTPYTILSRNKNQPGNDKAADYIQQKLEFYGLDVYNQSFSSTGRNVYAVQTGTDFPNRKYIISAHYDDMPYGTIAPGADDNASGTAAVLEAARILSNYASEYTIVYALWDEEEQGLVGSSYFAQQAALAGDSIMGVINMDMIAYDSDNDAVGEIHIRPVANSLTLKDTMVEVITNYNTGVNPSIINPGTTASDQASFWNNGYGALLLIEEYYGGDFNAYYHTTNDLISHYNFPYYLKMSKTGLGTLATLVNITNIVPVELVSFSAIAMQDGVKLEWKTATELNNQGFEIERSVNGNVFATVGFVEGNGTSSEINYYSYTDHPFIDGVTKIYYRLKQVDFDGSFKYSNKVEVELITPLEFALEQNYPNPFNPSTVIKYSIPDNSFVTLNVYNLLGRKVATLVNDLQEAGSYEITFNASNLASGVYVYRLQSGSFNSVMKMILVK
ncbi:bacterial leucyl aminopeptidase precursor [bacterium BMS3Abin03]|nr:bacterial leucyl aminopeptidase precursor [bacterium BMS3Abin03]